MVELGSQDTDWVGGNDKEGLDGVNPRDDLIPSTLSMDKGKCGYVGWVSGWFSALRGSPESEVVELGCQDTNWVGGNDKEVLDGIIPRDGLILATLSMDKGKCGYVGWVSGWFRALRGAPRVTDG